MNLRELFSKYPLGCESFNAEWLRRWSEVGRLLDARAQIGVKQGGTLWYEYYELHKRHGQTVAHCIAHVNERTRIDPALRFRIALPDGIIVKEWPAI